MVRVRVFLGRVGRAGLPGAFWCASPFLRPVLVRSLLVRPPPGWVCPVCGCCCVFFSLSPSPLCPRCLLLCVFCGLGCLRPWRLVAPPPSPPFFFLAFVLCFLFFLRPRCLWRFVFSGPGCLRPLLLVVSPPPPPHFFSPPPLLFFLFFLCFYFVSWFFLVFFFAGCAVRGGFVCLGLWGVPVCASVCCPCRCSLCGARSPLWRWLVLSGVACFFLVFALGPGCPLLSPGGSWCRVPVVLSLSGSVACHPVVWRGVSWCSAALCFVLLCYAVVWWCAVVICCLFASLPVPVVCFLPLRVCCVCSPVSCCVFPVPSALCGAVLRCAGALALCCPRRLCCFWCLVLLVPGVAACCWGSAGGSGCRALSFGGVCRLWCPCLVWPSLGVFPVVS